MPQVYNKSLSYDNSTGIGQNSRYMASVRFTEMSLRRVNVINSLQNNLTQKKLDNFDRHLNNQIIYFERIKHRLVDDLHTRLAYKMVLKNHNISQAKDYHKALDERHTFGALHNEVKDMMQVLKPAYIRARKAKALANETKQLYNNIVFQNTHKFNQLFPEKKTWVSRCQGQNENDANKQSTLSIFECNAKRGIAAIRRQVITVDYSKPNVPQNISSSPDITPAKTSSINKSQSSNSRKIQEISMYMMKKQKSFTECRTITKDEFKTNMETELEIANIVDATEKPDATDISNTVAGTANLRHNMEGQGKSTVTAHTKLSFLLPIDESTMLTRR